MSRRIALARLMVIAILSVLAILNIWQPGGERVLGLISDLLYLGAATSAAGLAFLAGSRFDRGSLQRRAWSLLGLGLGLWTVAECLWTYFQIGAGEDVPYPSVADGIWAVGYAPLILGLYLGHRALGVRLPARHRLLVLITYAAALAVFSWCLLRPMFYGPSPASPNEAFMGSYYLVGNLTLAFIGTLSLIVVWDGLIGLPWLSITLGLLLFAVSDSAFAYAVWRGTYAVGANWQSAVIDVAYLTAYLAVALAAFRQSSLRLEDVVRPRGTG
jgi:hypothetical protein